MIRKTSPFELGENIDSFWTGALLAEVWDKTFFAGTRSAELKTESSCAKSDGINGPISTL